MKNQQRRIGTALRLMICSFVCLMWVNFAEALPNAPKNPFDSASVPVFSGGKKIGEAAGTQKDFRESWQKDPPRPSQTGQTVSASHANKPKKEDEDDDKEEDKEKEEKKDEAEKATSRTANGQTIFEMTKDGKKYEYYYINGQKGDFISQYDSSSGSFKWTTKDAMLGNVDRSTGLREVGSIQLQDGRLTKMYQTPGDSGQYVFNNGNSWVGSPSMGNGSVYQELISPNFVGENGLPGTLPREGLFVKGPVDSPVSVAGSPGSMPVSDPFAVPVNDGSMFGLPSTQSPSRIPASTPQGRWVVTGCNTGKCNRQWVSN